MTNFASNESFCKFVALSSMKINKGKEFHVSKTDFFNKNHFSIKTALFFFVTEKFAQLGC